MKNRSAKSRVQIITILFIVAILAVWFLFYYIISDYISERTNRQITQAAEQIIERFGGEFSQIERLTNALRQNPEVNTLMQELNPQEFFLLAGEIDGLLEAKAINPDFIDSIILIGADKNYYRLLGRLGNRACSRLVNIIGTMDMPGHLSVELENRRYIGYANTLSLHEETISGAVVILIEEERILELLRAYDQSGSLLVAISVNNEVITANTERINLFAPESLHRPMIHSRLGITPYRISVTADESYTGESLRYFTVIAIITAVIFAIVLFIFTDFLYRSFKNQEKQKALVFSLKKQINAHFTINTLNTVRLLVEGEEFEKAETVAMGLTSLVRYAYDRDEIINIWDELYVLEDYILIMNSRYNGKLDVEFDFDDRLMDYYMPRMLLQPIIENSIVHGFKEMDTGCNLYIKAELKTGNVIFTIKDNGCGMSENEAFRLKEKLEEVTEPLRGYENIALLNIKNRLYNYYSKAGQLYFSSDIKDGTVVSMTIPATEKTDGDKI